MSSLADYQDPLALALIIKANLAQDRPGALVALTSNPGNEGDHYVALVQRVYADKDDLSSFAGYITYRYKEVKYRKKTDTLPVFSSIELRDADFNALNPPQKVHFLMSKVSVTAPARAKNAIAAGHEWAKSATPAPTVYQITEFINQEVGKDALSEVYRLVLAMIDARAGAPKP